MAQTFSARSLFDNYDFATFYYIESVLKTGKVTGYDGNTVRFCFGLRYKGELLPKGVVPMGCMRFNWQTARTESLLCGPAMTQEQKAEWDQFFAEEERRLRSFNAERVALESWTGHADGNGFNVFVRKDFDGCIRQNPKNGTAEVFLTCDVNDNPTGDAVYEEPGRFECDGAEQLQRCILFIDGLV